MTAPVAFTQVYGDGWSSRHDWHPRAADIIRRNLTRTDLPEPIVHVTVTHDDGSRATYRRRV